MASEVRRISQLFEEGIYPNAKKTNNRNLATLPLVCSESPLMQNLKSVILRTRYFVAKNPNREFTESQKTSNDLSHRIRPSLEFRQYLSQASELTFLSIAHTPMTIFWKSSPESAISASYRKKALISEHGCG